jgi:hypothetical protein
MDIRVTLDETPAVLYTGNERDVLLVGLEVFDPCM